MDDQTTESATLLESNERKLPKRITASGYLQIVGCGNVLGILTAAAFTFVNGLFIGYTTYLFLNLVDETSLYKILFIDNNTAANASCDWNNTGLLELNRSEFKKTLYHRSDDTTTKVLFIVGIYGISWLISQALWITTMHRFMKDFRAGFLREIFSKPMAWYDICQPTELALYLTESTQVVAGLDRHFTKLLTGSGTIVACYYFAYSIEWKIALILNCGLVAVAIFSLLLLKIASKVGYETESIFAKATYIAEECIANIRIVKAFGGENNGTERFKKIIEKTNSHDVKKSLALAVALSCLAVASLSTAPVGFWIGTYRIEDCDKTLEDIVKVVSLILVSSSSFMVSFNSVMRIGTIFGVLNKIINIWLQESDLIDGNNNNDNTFDLVISEGKIRFSNVSFSYPSRPGVGILQGIDFSVEAGQKVALVGRSGCGKSTLTKLLLGLYECDGSIQIDDVDIKYVNKHLLRQQIGVVPQEPVLFNTTIYENIAYGYGSENPNIWNVEKAAKLANAHNFITNLPQGYNTNVGEGGIQLSGGQKQRIAIARALIGNPSILILDEPSSALDKENELIIEEALNVAMKGRTTIVVAHKLSTIERADVIVGIENGCVVELGSHADLIERKGMYYGLMMKQLNLRQGHGYMEILNNKSMKKKTKAELLYNIPDKDTDSAGHKGGLLTLVSMKKTDLLLIGITCVAIFCRVIPVILLTALVGNVIKALTTFDDDKQSAVRPVIIVYAALVIFECFGTFVGAFAVTHFGHSFANGLRYKMLAAIMKKDIAWFDRPDNASSILIGQLSAHPAQVQRILGEPIVMLVIAFAYIGGTISAVLFLSLLTGSVLSLAIILILIMQIFHSLIHFKFFSLEKPLVKSINKTAVESVANIFLVKVLGISSHFMNKYEEKLKKLYKLRLLQNIFAAFLLDISFPVSALACISVLYFSLRLYVKYEDNQFSSAVIISQVMMVGYLGVAVFRNALVDIPDLQDAMSSANKILELLQHINSDIDKGITVSQNKLGSQLSLKNIQFVYPSRPNTQVLKNVSIYIPSGQTVAIVGPSGSGKSTIVSLLERFYDPLSGTIMLGDIDTRVMNLSWLRQNLSIVSQEPVLFDMSITDNIRYGALFKTVTMDEIIDASKAANIHDFIESLPKGYETRVGSRGVQLSGGQKQRIAIARALVKKPKILLLDEATSSLDAESEKIVQEALNVAMQDCTTLIIAHRLSTIQNADMIVVLDGGVIVEQGTHSELIARRGVYYQMNQ